MKWLAIGLLKLYKLTLSKLIGKNCRYYPTCSVYSMEAYYSYGFFIGTFLTAKRLLRCTPWGKGGVDLVPLNIKGEAKWSL